MNKIVDSVKGSKENTPFYDVVVIGGGVNGTAIARDAAGRGYKTVLFETGDLAAATSSASTKLIHGGLRYLEYGEFRLVQKALQEREILLRNAPHIMWPMRFVLPIGSETRPSWMIRFGLWMYDRLAKRDVLPASTQIDLSSDDRGKSLQTKYKIAFEYSDVWADDARLCILQATDAARNGAHIHPRTSVHVIEPHGDRLWKLGTGAGVIHARMVVNATGPWVRHFLDENNLSDKATPHVRLVRGSHIIVPKIFEGDHAYIFQQPDKRIVFAIPYEKDMTLIGTTDADHGDDPSVVPTCSKEEAEYLCEAVNRYFDKKTSVDDVISTYSGVRSLFDDRKQSAAAITRDYRLYSQNIFGAPILSIYGGKLTTARVLALDVMAEIEQALGARAPSWTHRVPLPGGNLPEDFFEFIGDVSALFPWCPTELLTRYAHAYGTNLGYIVNGANSVDDLGPHFGAGLYAREVDYLCMNEWAKTSEDILWRRSKLGLYMDASGIKELDEYLRIRFSI